MLAAWLKRFPQRFRQLRSIGGLAASIFLLAGCDPGVYLRPTDWKEISPMVHATQIGVVELQAHDIGGLVGETYGELDLRIIDPQHKDFMVEGATLRTDGEEYAAKAGKAYKCCGDSDDVTRQEFFWKFDKPIYKVFGKTGELDLDIREARSQRIVTVDLEQCLPGNC